MDTQRTVNNDCKTQYGEQKPIFMEEGPHITSMASEHGIQLGTSNAYDRKFMQVRILLVQDSVGRTQLVQEDPHKGIFWYKTN